MPLHTLQCPGCTPHHHLTALWPHLSVVPGGETPLQRAQVHHRLGQPSSSEMTGRFYTSMTLTSLTMCLALVLMPKWSHLPSSPIPALPLVISKVLLF